MDDNVELIVFRFQMLRDLVPHSDQKRDKASFLLEVMDLNTADENTVPDVLFNSYKYDSCVSLLANAMIFSVYVHNPALIER